MSPQTPASRDVPLSGGRGGALMTDFIFVFVNMPRQRRRITVEKTLAGTTENSHVVSESEPLSKVFVAVRDEKKGQNKQLTSSTITDHRQD